MTSAPGGMKYDENKVPLDLLPLDALWEWAKVLAFGAKKYAPWNWAKGFKWSRLYAAAQRHMMAFWMGEEYDQETGLSHLAHALCCVSFLLVHQLRKLGEDDRHRWVPLEPRPAETPPAHTSAGLKVCGCGHAINDHGPDGCTAVRFPDIPAGLQSGCAGVPCICKQQGL